MESDLSKALPHSAAEGGWLASVRQVFAYRDAIRNLAVRDLKVRYSSSILGILWSLLHPLALMVVFTLIFTAVMPSGIEKYPVFFLAGLLPWNFFSLSLTGCTVAVTGSSHLISRVYFPREILPISVVAANGVHFLIALILLFVFILLYQVPLTLTVFWLPALLLIQIALSLGLGLLLSALNVHFRDTQQIVEVLLLPWFFLTPIIYSLDQIVNPLFRRLILYLNPMAALIDGYRHILYVGTAPNLMLLMLTSAEVLLILLIGYVVFRSLSPAFAEEL